MTPAELKNFIIKLQDGNGAKMIEHFGINPTFTGESLKEIEDAIDKHYPEGHTPLYSTIIPFAFYFGETIVRNFKGAEWFTEGAKELNEIKVKIPSRSDRDKGLELMIYPFVRAEKFWFDRTDTFTSMYNTLPFVLEKSLDKKYMEKVTANDGWVYFPDNEKIRITQIKKKTK